VFKRSLIAALLLTVMTTHLLYAATPLGSVAGEVISEINVANWSSYYLAITNPAHQFKDHRFFGVSQELQTMLYLNILKKYGISVSEDALAAYAKAAEQSKPEIAEFYKRLREQVKTDEKSFTRTFFMNAYTADQLKLTTFRKETDKINAERKKEAESIAAKLEKAPGGFNSYKDKYPIKTIKASMNNGIIVDTKNPEIVSIPLSVASQEAENVAKALKPSKSSKSVVSTREYFLIVKNRGKKGDDYLLDAIFIPKLSFDEWFQIEIKSIPVKISDLKIKKDLLERVSWVKNLKL